MHPTRTGNCEVSVNSDFRFDGSLSWLVKILSKIFTFYFRKIRIIEKTVRIKLLV